MAYARANEGPDAAAALGILGEAPGVAAALGTRSGSGQCDTDAF